MATGTRHLRARVAAPTLFGPQASSASFTRRDSRIPPSAVSPAAPNARTATASAEIQRARDLLRDLLLRDDETDDLALVSQVSSGLNEIVVTLDSLAGLQKMFEVWAK